MRKTLLILLLGTIGLTARSETNTTQDKEYFVKHYTPADGLSQNIVTTMLQDKKGFLWLGTWDGLNKFDGYQFTVYKRLGDGRLLRNSRVEYLYEDAEDRIWFQTYDNRLYCFDRGRDRIYAIADLHKPIDGRHTQGITESGRGDFWVTAHNGIAHIRPTKEGFVCETTETQSTPHFVIRDEEERVWFCTDKGLVRTSPPYKETEVMIERKALTASVLTSSYADKQGVWFGSDKGEIWHYIAQGKHFETIRLDKECRITQLTGIGGRDLIITTTGGGVYILNRENGALQHFDSESHPEIKSDNFYSVVTDSKGTAWLENDSEGIFRYRPEDGSLKYLTTERDPRFAPLAGPNMIVTEDSDKNLWVNPRGGGFSLYNHEKDCLERKFDYPTNIVHSAYADRGGSLWLCTYDKGLDRIDIEPQQFALYDMRQNAQESGEVRAMLQLRNGDLLTADKDGHVCLTRHLSGEREVLPLHYIVYCMHEDSEGGLWLGTRYNGLVRLTQSGEGMRISQHYTADGTDGCLSSEAVYDIVEDSKGRLFVATYGGGVNIMEDGRFIHSGNSLTDYPQEASKVRDLLLEGDSILWAATTAGIVRIDLTDNTCHMLPTCDTRCLLQNRDGVIYAGTFGGGLLTIGANDSLITLTEQPGTDIILSMTEDRNGKLWLTSENELIRYDTQSGRSQHFTPLKGRENAYFNEAQIQRLHSGEIMAGYTNGYCRFSPDHILRSNEIPPLGFTNFQLFNNDIHPGTEGSPLTRSISQTEEIHLSHKQSVFSIEYAALDFSSTDKIEYAFRLEGFEKDWNYVQKQRKATYTNLPAGTYRFYVRSTNAEGVWADNMQSIVIHIHPSFWRTNWAILIYIALLLLILYIAGRFFIRYNGLQQNIEIEKQVSDLKLRFFTNISHELRTPLTLIIGPVENILRTEKINSAVRMQLEIVQSNSKRMLRLINEILDLRKIQNQKMRLKVQPSRLATLVEETCSHFHKEIYDKRIQFRIENNIPDAEVWVDREKIDIILFNLLSNAFKFTPAGKHITVRVSKHKEFILLQVIDEGIGISKEQRSLLFERFSSHNKIAGTIPKTGTGIGLNLVKELVDLHHGYIEVESDSGKGSTFTVMLRTGNEHFGNEVDIIPHRQETSLQEDEPQSKLEKMEAMNKPHTLLIVEDNEDMRTFLSSIFHKDLNILTASNGTEGVERAKEYVPDIVITDLMMPDINGIELTQQLKRDERTAHIPIILLTAKSAIEDRLAAMQNEADDYITKPFSAEYLQARVNNLLQQRQKLQQSYRQNLLKLEPIEKQKKTPDEAFLAKLMDLMERNMDNSALKVEDLVNEVAFGRTAFFNKLKSLTGLSPVEFIREVRVKRAAQLLEEGNYNVTEITYMVGMNDARYLSKSFKTLYGMTPSEYKRSVNANKKRPKKTK